MTTMKHRVIKIILSSLTLSLMFIALGCTNTTDAKISVLESENKALQEQINNLQSTPTPSPEPTFSEQEIAAAEAANIVKDSLIDPSSFTINSIIYLRYESEFYGLLGQKQNIILIDYTAKTRGGGVNRQTVSVRYNANYKLLSVPNDAWGTGYIITHNSDITDSDIKETIELDIEVILQAMELRN